MTAQIPSSILIIGSGVFGLSTAYALSQRPSYSSTKITLLDRSSFPAPDSSSIDSSRIVRADYADPAYARLAAEARELWRGHYGAENRYSPSGLCLVLGDEAAAVGRNYLEASLVNVRDRLGCTVGRREDGAEITVLEGKEAVAAVTPTMGGCVAAEGYVNWTSGWADAQAGMEYLRKLVEGTGRVEFAVAEVEQLLFKHGDGGEQIEGAVMKDGRRFVADLTILATGAWTPKLLDLRGIASASGQVLCYAAVTEEEQTRLEANPTLLDEGNGCFIIPPRHHVLKVARHGYGYANPTTIPHPEKDRDTGETIQTSLPWTKHDDPTLQVPSEGSEACRDFLAKAIPELAQRGWMYTRICWYTDTRTGDFLIDYHPRYGGLFVATGGSGHAYKFMPVIGERIVDVLDGTDRDELGRELRAKWKWPARRHDEDHIWTDDWRGGRKGMILREELQKGRAEVIAPA